MVSGVTGATSFVFDSEAAVGRLGMNSDRSGKYSPAGRA